MFNFNSVVASILLEADEDLQPAWVKGVLEKHKQLGLGELSSADVRKIFNIASKGYISGQDVKSVQKYVLLLDVFTNVWEKTKAPKPAKVLEDFFKNTSSIEEGNKELAVIDKFSKKEQWQVTNGSVANALQIQPSKSRLDYLKQSLGALVGFSGASLYGGPR
jgi:hypothetical protein